MIVFIAKIARETKAASSNCICPSNCVIKSETGLLSIAAKKDTAEIVIIEFTKKYDIISAIVPLDSGMRTSIIILNLLIPSVFPTASKFEFSLLNVLYIIRYGEEKKWIMLTNIKIAKVP